MKYTFITKSEIEANKILEVLEYYCVPKQMSVEHEDNFIFKSDTTWKISVDLETEPKKKADGTYIDSPLSFILTKVNQALKTDTQREQLERAYNRNIVRPPLPSEKSKIDINNNSIEPIGNIIERCFNQANPKKNDFWGSFKRFFNKKLNKKKPMSFKDFLDNITQENTMSNSWQDLLKEKNMPNMIPDPMNILGCLGGLFSDKLVENMNLEGINNFGENISFDDLSPEEQQQLLDKHPISLLRSSKCKIKRIKKGPVTALFVSIEM